jgi:hypothetical protein
MNKTTLKTYQELEKKGVYIHYIPEHYDDGSNLSFSIEFRHHNKQTGWFNDNHEFGDVYNTMIKSIKLAKWYLEDIDRIEMMGSGYNKDNYLDHVEQLFKYIDKLNNKH